MGRASPVVHLPARQALGSHALPIATKGRALSLDEAVAEAMNIGSPSPQATPASTGSGMTPFTGAAAAR